MSCHCVNTTYPVNDANNSKVYGMEGLYVTMAFLSLGFIIYLSFLVRLLYSMTISWVTCMGWARHYYEIHNTSNIVYILCFVMLWLYYVLQVESCYLLTDVLQGGLMEVACVRIMYVKYESYVHIIQLKSTLQ